MVESRTPDIFSSDASSSSRVALMSCSSEAKANGLGGVFQQQRLCIDNMVKVNILTIQRSECGGKAVLKYSIESCLRWLK
jgi:hypothetical protein